MQVRVFAFVTVEGDRRGGESLDQCLILLRWLACWPNAELKEMEEEKELSEDFVLGDT
jgi:hypothetical protein